MQIAEPEQQIGPELSTAIVAIPQAIAIVSFRAPKVARRSGRERTAGDAIRRHLLAERARQCDAAEHETIGCEKWAKQTDVGAVRLQRRHAGGRGLLTREEV